MSTNAIASPSYTFSFHNSSIYLIEKLRQIFQVTQGIEDVRSQMAYELLAHGSDYVIASVTGSWLRELLDACMKP